MFTGLVEEIGEIVKISKGMDSSKLTIGAEKVIDKTKLGDSIAVNGTCVTVVDLNSNSFTVDVMAETLRMGSLGSLRVGSRVNLERALKVGDRLGGHIVSGHIDGVGKVVDVHDEDISTWLEIEIPLDLMKYVVLKGSISLDGVSLTIARLNKNSFSVSLIPHTKGETMLYYRKTGDLVNIECDLVGKYVERLMDTSNRKIENRSSINSEMLKKYGFV
ncbi:riboflavin synthase [Clostridium sp. LBM24168]